MKRTNQLIEKIQAGNNEVYRELMQNYYSTVQRFAFQCGVQQSDLDDVTQEVFIKLYRFMEKYRDEQFTTWLYKITLNTARDFYRKKSKQQEKLARLQIQVHEQQNSAIDFLLQLDEEDRELHMAIIQLGENYRYPIVLYYFHDMTMPEIAKVLGLTVSNVKVRLMRARSKLKKILQLEEEAMYES